MKFEGCYRLAYDLTQIGGGHVLYAGMTELLENHLQNLVKTFADMEGEDFLKALVLSWNTYKGSLRHITRIVMYCIMIALILLDAEKTKETEEDP